MKKLTLVSLLITFAAAASLAGCSSGKLASDMPAQPGTNNAEFNAVTNPDGAAAASAEPSPGAVVDTANPSATVADNSAYSPPSFTEHSSDASTKSPVNLGASSAGRAH